MNLIAAFGIYLWVALGLSVVLSAWQMRSLPGLLRTVRGRWPHLTRAAVARVRWTFVNWSIVLPLSGVLSLVTVHTVLRRFVWAGATISPGELSERTAHLAAAIAFGAAVVIMDYFSMARARSIEIGGLELGLDLGEFLLRRPGLTRSVRLLTFGTVRLREKVESEVDEAIERLQVVMASKLRYLAVANLCRIGFGTTLWLAFRSLALET